MKKLLGILISLTLILSASFGVMASVKNTESDLYYSDDFCNEEEVFNAWGGFSKQEILDYAGMYIDDNNNLTLMFVENSPSLKNAEMLAWNKSGVLSDNSNRKQALVIKSAKYSYSTLTNVMSILTDKVYSNPAIRNISVDVRNNNIDIGINDISNEKNIYEFIIHILKERNIQSVEPNIISFHEEPDEKIELLVSVNGNSRINKKTSTTITYASVGVGYYRPSTGQRGFITCGHGFSNNDTIYSGNTKIGTITKRVYNGTCDASFVLFDSEDNYVSNTTLYEQLSTDVPIVGTTVSQRGSYSGTVSGKVTSNNFSYTGNGYTWNNLIKTNKAMQNGDSGGGMKCGVIDAGRTSKIVGFLHGGTNTYSVYIKGSVVNSGLY